MVSSSLGGTEKWDLPDNTVSAFSYDILNIVLL